MVRKMARNKITHEIMWEPTEKRRKKECLN